MVITTIFIFLIVPAPPPPPQLYHGVAEPQAVPLPTPHPRTVTSSADPILTSRPPQTTQSSRTVQPLAPEIPAPQRAQSWLERVPLINPR